MSIEIAAAAAAVKESAGMINEVVGVFVKLKKALVAQPNEALSDSLDILGKIETSYETVVASLREFVDLDIDLPSARSKLDDFTIGEGLACVLNTASIKCKNLDRVRTDRLQKLVGYAGVEEALTRLSHADNNFMDLMNSLVRDLKVVATNALDAYENGNKVAAKRIIEEARRELRESRKSASSALEHLQKSIRDLQAEALRI